MPIEARRLGEAATAERSRLTRPASSASAAKLAARYRRTSLGDLAVQRRGPSTWFDFGGWKSEVASRHNADGTTSFVTISAGARGYELVLTDATAPPSLVLRDAQHEYVFTETK